MTSTDVAVIGAGPAGSTLAALLAGRGIDVTLIDRDLFPRDKLCGEFLSYDALPVLEHLDVIGAIDDAVAPHITRCRVVGSGRTYEFTFPHPARGVSRLFLDNLLFRRAAALGARTLVGRSASAIEPTNVTLDDGRVVEARILVGAWGRWGRFDAQLERPFIRDRSHRNFGFKRHYRGSAERETIELHSFPRGYLGVSGVEDGLTNICGLVHASRLAGHKGRWDSFLETIREERPGLDAMYSRFEPAQDGFLSSDPVIFRARAPVEGGVLMIGDASGVIDPLTGNGMAMAIQSALLAAPHIVDLLTRPEDRPSIERAYIAAHREMFANRIAWSRRTAKLLSRPTLLDAALALYHGPGAGNMLLRKTRATRDDIARRAETWFR
jgi:flavin-dependent dehydrogenase